MNFKQKYHSLKTLTGACIKMYIRNKTAVIFTLLFPLAMLGVFGFLSKSNGAGFNLELTNHSRTLLAQEFVNELMDLESVAVTVVDEGASTEALGNGDIDLQVIIPGTFGQVDSNGELLPSQIVAHYNQANPQNGQVATMILSQIANGFNYQITGNEPIIEVNSTGVTTNNLNFFDFILPGILAMTIMQLGIFGVSFAFVSLKASGALRRLQATPVHPRNFLFAQSITRLLVSVASITILLILGIWFFDFHMIGSYFNFALIGLLGTLVFLAFGFAVAGWAKDENQVAPVANIIQLPMLLLSGIFFSRDAFPDWLHRVTDFFPLTYLSDGLRLIANEGASLAELWVQFLGLFVWGIIVYLIAIKVFRWD